MNYADFLALKVVQDRPSGFDCGPLNPRLFGFQADTTRWACKRGKAAIWADCGLGKTAMQLEYSRCVVEHTGGSVLILAPLNVVEQTIREGLKFGIECASVRSQDEVTKPGVYVTNYEMLDNFDTESFAGVVLDESSILKAYTGKTKQLLCSRFASTQFRLCCTATPAPNDHMELGNHADFLGVMASSEMLARWFVSDSMEAGNYRLKRHAEDDFWAWVASWAASIGKPSDLGYPDDGFDLPALRMYQHTVDMPASSAWKKGALFDGDSLSACGLWKDKRDTLDERTTEVARIVEAEPEQSWIVWCSTDYEADAIVSALPECIEVRGSMPRERKAELLRKFGDGRARIIVTKPGVAGLGLNWQHCARQVFASLTYSFEDVYQAIRRSFRFGQTREVQVHIVTAESEGNIVATIKRKQEDHEKMKRRMCESMKEHGLLWSRQGGLKDSEQDVQRGEGWELNLADSCEWLAKREPESIDFCVHSPPFKDLYIYSDNAADLGNSGNDEEFFEHYRFIIRDLLRVTRPGRLCAVHCKDLPLYKNRDGASGLYDFPGDIIACFEAEGWTFHSRVTIWKDPVIEMQRTKNHGLLHKNFVARREVCRMGMADFVLVFRKWTESTPDRLVTDAPIPGDYIGEDAPEHWDSQRDWSIQTWQKYASPVWMDIRQTNVLQYMGARSEKDEKHICPLQLDVIERLVWLYTNKGDVVYDPFGGVGSTVYVARKMGRVGVSSELKRSYWEQSVNHLRTLDRALTQHSMFSEDE